MAYKVPVSGVFASIYYDFETNFGVYPNSNQSNYYLGIDKMLGHGVKITRWTRDNSITVIKGLNNIEASTAVDGPYVGEMDIEFAMTGDISWIYAIMGKKTVSDIIEFTKGGTPHSMRFALYIQNDMDNEIEGDLYIIKGVVVKKVSIAIGVADAPVTVKMELAYQTEEPKGIYDMPPPGNPSDNVFNFAEAIAYFWNPGEVGDGPASFNSLETIIEKFNIDIDHGSEMLQGIGARIARDKWHKNLTYKADVTAIYRDRERFLEKFFGCSDGPVNDVVSPMRKILVVLQNSKFCGESFRRVEFEFNIAKLATVEMPIDIENAIKEEMTIVPMNAVIRMYNGVDPDPEFVVSPYHIKQGDVIVFRTFHFPPGEYVNLYLDGVLISTQRNNCIGSMEYRMLTTSSWTVGKHTITATSFSSPGEETISLDQEVYVTTETGSIPKVVVCPAYFSSSENGSYGPITITGYNFGSASDVATCTLTFGTMVAVNMVPYMSNNASFFKYTIPANGIALANGNHDVSVTATDALGGSYWAKAIEHITNLTYTTSGTVTRTIRATGMIPMERCNVYIDGAYVGATIADYFSNASITLDVADGTYTVEFIQNVITSDQTGQLIAKKENWVFN